MGAIHQFSKVLTGGMGVDALGEFRHGACPVRCAGLEGGRVAIGEWSTGVGVAVVLQQCDHFFLNVVALWEGVESGWQGSQPTADAG